MSITRRNFAIAIRFLTENDLVIVISQSGETADTIAAMREAKQAGCKVLAICNVQGSMITREADGTILTHAGPEIGVASTKAFTSQMVALYLFAMYLGQLRGKIDETRAKKLAQDLAELPLKIEQLLERRRFDRGTLERVFPRAGFPIPRPRHQFPGRSRRAPSN